MLALRDFQVPVVEETLQHLREGRSVMLQAATGAGKTVMGIYIALQYVEHGERVLILVPRRELAEQFAERLEDFNQTYLHDFGVLMAGYDDDEIMRGMLGTAPILISTKDTFRNRARKRRPRAALIIADEAHLSTSPTWCELMEFYKREGVPILGLSATPKCAKKNSGLGHIYDEMVRAPSVAEMIVKKLLVPCVYYAPDMPDLAKLEVRRGDYRVGGERGSAALMNTPRYVGSIVDHWQDLASTRQTFVFCCNVAHAKAVCDEFTSAGIPVGHLDGKMPLETRKETLAKFRSGEYRVLTNCEILTYGIDVPELGCVVIARPTKSIVLHRQMLGRGLRTAEGKRNLLVIDHTGNVLTLGRAEDPYEWKLTYTEGSEAKKPALPREIENIVCAKCSHVFKPQKACPECGYYYEIHAKGIEWLDGRLVVMPEDAREESQSDKSKSLPDSPRRKEAFYRGIVGYLVLKGKTQLEANRQAWAIYIEKYGGEKPDPEWWHMRPQKPTEAINRYMTHRNIRYRFRRSA